VIDSFRIERSSALYHVQRIHSMTQGLRIPVAWPHDGATHDKGSGLSLAGQYKGFGANMLPKHATNHGTSHYNVEPALAARYALGPPASAAQYSCRREPCTGRSAWLPLGRACLSAWIEHRSGEQRSP
jgi:hypothetical protein